jgi:LacI family transcriptional regulator
MKRPTFTDVAAHAGVSRATVSLVVRDSPQIPESTKERVRASMDALGYVYNRRAAEMRSLSSRIIGLVVANVRNPYFAELTMAVEQAAGAKGFTVLLGCSSDDVDRQTQVLRAMAEHQVDGVILLPASHSTPQILSDLLVLPRLPHVLVARAVNGFESDYVGADNEASGRLVGRHLRELGAKSVAFFGGVEHSVPREDRVRGLLAGLAPDVDTLTADVPSAYDSSEDLAPLVTEALRHGLPDAVVAYNDMYAFSVYSSLRAAGVEPGQDLAVVSFDDVPDAIRAYPALTSAAGYPDRVGATATDLLLSAIERHPSSPRHVLVPPSLHPRRSSLAWRGATVGSGSPELTA